MVIFHDSSHSCSKAIPVLGKIIFSSLIVELVLGGVLCTLLKICEKQTTAVIRAIFAVAPVWFLYYLVPIIG